MPNVGPLEILLLGLLAVIIFGPSKLPEIGRSVGRAARDFKDAIGGMGDVRETLDTVNEVRSAASPTNLAKAAMPASVKQVASDVTEMKETFTDPLGTKKKEAEEGEGEKAPDKAEKAPAASKKAAPKAEAKEAPAKADDAPGEPAPPASEPPAAPEPAAAPASKD